MRGVRADTSEVAWRIVPEKLAHDCALETGDILVTKSSGSSDLVGKATLFIHPEDGRGYLFSNFTLRLRPDREIVQPEFLAWFLRSPQSLLWRCETQQNAVGLRNLRTKEFLGQNIPVPPLNIQNNVVQYLELLEAKRTGTSNVPLPSRLEEQRHIVARIEALAAKIEEARGLRQRVTTEEIGALRSSVLRGVLGQGTTLHEEAGRTWRRVSLQDICSLITDGTHQTPHYFEHGMPFLSAQNVKPFRFMPEIHRMVSHEAYRAYTAHVKPRRNDILMTRVGAMIGEAALIDQDIDFAFYVSLCLIRPIQELVLPSYLVHWLNSPFGASSAREKTLGRGHSQGNLNLKLIREFVIGLPPLSEQHRIVAYLDNLQAKMVALKRLQAETAAELDALLPSILDKAFKGEL